MILSALFATAAMIEAAVRVELAVTPEGKVTGCRVLESELPEEAAASTCDALLKTASFRGARDGTPMPSKKTVTVVYQVPAGAHSDWATRLAQGLGDTERPTP